MVEKKVSYFIFCEGEFITSFKSRKPTKNDIDNVCWEYNLDEEGIEIFEAKCISEFVPSHIHYTDEP